MTRDHTLDRPTMRQSNRLAKSAIHGLAAATACLVFCLTSPAAAQTDIFADPENLKVLPEDISSRELRKVMREFAMGLGARCETCHMGEPGQDLSEFDFVSDDKEEKLAAREMLKMIKAINKDYISKLEKEDATQVRCVTCHRGVLDPRMSQDILGDALAEEGFDGLKSKYVELRERYYGSHSYDFTPGVLANLGQGAAMGGDTETAVSILSLNLEYSPDDFQTHFLLGEVYLRNKDKASAKKHYQRALSIMPNPMVQKRLDQLEE